MVCRLSDVEDAIGWTVRRDFRVWHTRVGEPGEVKEVVYVDVEGVRQVRHNR